MGPDDRRTARVVVASVAGAILLLVGAGLYLASFPDAKHSAPPAEFVPSDAAFADDPTPEELAEGELPVVREDGADWPPAVDCQDYGRMIAARDVYNDVQRFGRATRRRPSASLDLGAVRFARSGEFLCLAWVARRPPRVPMVIDLEMRELRDFGSIWAVRIDLGPDSRSVTVSWPGLGFRPKPARLDVVRRYGRLLLPAASMPHRLPEAFQLQVASRSPLLEGGGDFRDCVPDAFRLRYPVGGAEQDSRTAACAPQP